MEISQVLAELDQIKKEYLSIASKYPEVDYSGDCTVYFGSQMWMDEVIHYASDNTKERILEELEITEEQLLEDDEKCMRLIQKASKLLEDHNLSQFMIDGGVMYWIGALPEPYTSSY